MKKIPITLFLDSGHHNFKLTFCYSFPAKSICNTESDPSLCAKPYFTHKLHVKSISRSLVCQFIRPSFVALTKEATVPHAGRFCRLNLPTDALHIGEWAVGGRLCRVRLLNSHPKSLA